MSYLVQLLFVRINFLFHLSFLSSVGYQIQMSKLRAVSCSMLQCCVQSYIVLLRGGRSFSVCFIIIIIVVTIQIYLRISERDRGLSLPPKNYVSFIWALNNEKSLSKGRLVKWFTAIRAMSVTQIHVALLFLVAQVLLEDAIPHTPVKHCSWCCNQGGSSRQKQCSSCGEWWPWEETVLPLSTVIAQCAHGKCLQYRGHAAKGFPTNLL